MPFTKTFLLKQNWGKAKHAMWQHREIFQRAHHSDPAPSAGNIHFPPLCWN